MTEPFEVPVHTWLKPSTYRTYERLAKDRGTTIAVLLAHLADKALQPPAVGGRRMTPARLQELKIMYGQGASDRAIAQRLGFSTPAIRYHRLRLNLPRNHNPFGESS